MIALMNSRDLYKTCEYPLGFELYIRAVRHTCWCVSKSVTRTRSCFEKRRLDDDDNDKDNDKDEDEELQQQ
jgi:hypothetical protein